MNDSRLTGILALVASSLGAASAHGAPETASDVAPAPSAAAPTPDSGEASAATTHESVAADPSPLPPGAPEPNAPPPRAEPGSVEASSAPPPARLRPLSTDRPDTTESAYTVDRFHFQAEFDLARYTTEAGADSYSFMSSNLKVGLTTFWELQVVIDGLVGLPTDMGHEWGSGQIDLRSKFNLVGNDSGPIAVAVMPWLATPRAGTEDQLEGGLIGLFAWQLPADFSAGFMVQGDAVTDELDSDHHLELLHTWTIGHPIVGPLSGYIEGFGVYSTEPGAEYALSIDGGLTFAVTEYVQLDAGVAGGLTEPADDLSVFSGLSFKL